MGNLPGPALHGIRILVVDDDVFARKIVRRVMNDLKFDNVRQVDSGEAALALLQDQTFDLIITDVQMPGINGLEFARRIRSGQTRAAQDISIIVLTSFSNTEVLGVAMALDVNGFLVKPMEPVVVRDKIAQAMDERPGVRPPIAYRSVSTDLSTIHAQRATRDNKGVVNASVPRSEESELARLPKRSIKLATLRPGLRLGQDVVTSDGTLLLSAGQVLSQLNINRLLDLSSVVADELSVVDEGPDAVKP